MIRPSLFWTVFRHVLKPLLVAVLLLAGAGAPLFAREPEPPVVIPNLWDPKAKPDKPDMSSIRSIRFLTDDDFPPLHFADQEGRPIGFAVDLARAACEKLGVPCTIQARRFDTLLDALAENRGDAIAAAIPTTASLLDRFSATRPYHRTPARFMARSADKPPEPGAQAIAGRSVGVVAGSAHEAYLQSFFPNAQLKPFPDAARAASALKAGEVEYVFGDGMGMALWLGGSEAGKCCGFIGGPYLSQRFFGEGIGFIVRRGDLPLQRALDYALQALWDDGTYAELYLRYFPISFY